MVVLKLPTSCNNHCFFCLNRYGNETERNGDTPGLADFENQLKAAASAGISKVLLTGGEPTLYDNLDKLLKTVKDLGFVDICLHTNGRRLAYPTFAEHLFHLGVNHYIFTIYGPSADIHQFHTQVNGSFNQTIKGLLNLAKNTSSITVTQVLTRCNYRNLLLWIPILKKIGISTLNIEMLQPYQNDKLSFLQYVPRLGMIKKQLNIAANSFHKKSLWLQVSGMPHCLILSPDNRKLPQKKLWDTKEVYLQPDPLSTEPFSNKCIQCTQKNSCSGISAEYLERFGDEELYSFLGLAQK